MIAFYPGVILGCKTIDTFLTTDQDFEPRLPNLNCSISRDSDSKLLMTSSDAIRESAIVDDVYSVTIDLTNKTKTQTPLPMALALRLENVQNLECLNTEKLPIPDFPIPAWPLSESIFDHFSRCTFLSPFASMPLSRTGGSDRNVEHECE